MTSQEVKPCSYIGQGAMLLDPASGEFKLVPI